MTELPDHRLDLGEFIRNQRETARLSLRRLSSLTGISNPYLSQIERGLRRPSAEILQQIARGLHLSAETLYVRAGILDPDHAHGDVVEQISSDSRLDAHQRAALVRIYRSFLHENGYSAGAAHDPVSSDEDSSGTGATSVDGRHR